MNKQAGLIAAIIALVFAAWWAGYALIGQPDPTPKADTPVTVITEPQPFGNNDGLGEVSEDGGDAKKDIAFRFEGWEPDMSGNLTKACLNFTDSIGMDDTRFTDYVTTTPDAKLAASVQGRRVCLSGFDFSREYELTIKAGLPGPEGKTLAEDRNVTIDFGDKPSVLRFAGDGIILPRIGAQGLAIETINVDTISLDISSVNDRIIAQRDPQSGESAAEGDYSYVYENAATSVRESVWSGEISVKSKSNQTVTTVVPIANIIGDLKPGAYVISAERKSDDSENRPARAWRWVIVTDLAITSYQSDDALNITLRSINTARTVSNSRVTLVASNNRVLGEARTDVNGHARFDGALLKGQGASAPRMIMAYGPDGDYAMLDMQRSPLDLSDRNVNGRTVSGALDPYIYTDRGVYRPGETVHLVAMLRSHRGAAAPRDGTFKLVRPNGIVALEKRFTQKDLLSGSWVHSFDLPESAPRGVWRVEIYADGLDLVGSQSIAVEDFIPQKITVDIKSGDGFVTNEDGVKITLASEFLYGGPGKNLTAEAQMRVRVDPNPFPAYSDFNFGLATETFQEESVILVQGITNEKGELITEASLAGLNISSSHPLRGEITAGIAEPGGRYVKNSGRIAIRTNPLYLGIRPNFDDDRAARRKPATLDLLAVNAEGAPQAKTLDWKLVYEDWDYVWYRSRGEWKYRYTINDELRDSGEVATGADGMAEVSQTLDWGRYRLIVTDPETDVTSSYQFSVGWGGASTSDRPDQLVIAGPTEPARPNSIVELTLKAPYAGQGELVIASDKVHEIRAITIPEGGSTISIRTDASWGASAYAMITLYTPRDTAARPVPRRAVGVAHIAMSAKAQTLGLSIEAPEVTRPRQVQNVTVKIDGIGNGQNYLTLAAVDEGILRITKFESPNAQDWYFGKKALSLEVRDDYARLLNPNMGQAAMANSGGDGLGGEGLTVTPTRIVALWSGIINVKGGKAVIPLSLPDFNGEVRLMATAWNDQSVGSASRSMKIRDRVPATLTLPRFIAPGDTAIATLSLDNVEGDSGLYNYTITGGDLKTSADSSGAVQLAKQQRERGLITLSSDDEGISTVDYTVTGPGDYTVSSDYQIQSRSPYMPVERRIETRMSPNQTLAMPDDLMTGLNPESVQINISFSASPDLDPTAYAASLVRYPYGCTEQTVSSGLPLLYASDLGGMPRTDEGELKRQMQNAVYKISNRMDAQGSFGLWRAGDNAGQAWLGAYATEFLQRADAKDYDVPDDVMRRAYSALREMTRMESYSSLAYEDYRYQSDRDGAARKIRMAQTAAYAHYVLARGGKGDLSKMRYFYDTHRKNLRSPMAFAHIGTGFSMMGDSVRAKNAFDAAFSAVGYDDNKDYYQTPLRDSAALVYLSDEAKMPDRVAQAQSGFAKLLRDPDMLSTQEKAQTIMAMRAVRAGAADIDVSSRGVSGFGSNETVALSGAEMSGDIAFTNTGQSDIYRVVSIYGTPNRAPQPVSQGYQANKKSYSISGNPVDLSSMVKGQQAVIVLTVRSDMNRTRQTVIADLLPAGLEIETILRPADGKTNGGINGPFEWVGEIADLDMAEARDDRFVGSLKLSNRNWVRMAYVVRAVTAGDFAIPGAIIEDMYRPGDIAITPAGRITILTDKPG
ncbi:alpha-2-macroglobulin family protein [Robiginitomaculum antarcticum]|uniref:alpha-2-macroglobulin family protein n=1 Tax=Robiginitomaculum antarcticum TaxID=437507 RepID=UPI00037C74AB|nr:alpha-2-macroglobulin [Robiginitomaculum antarcticum]